MVTGGAGYIGSVLCDLLLRSGYNVTLVDRFFFGRKPISKFKKHPGLTVVKCDLRDTEKIAPLLKRGMSIIHLGSLSNDPSCDLDPQWSVRINHEATVNLADAAKRAGVKRFVFASSCSVYGFGSETALKESSECNPVSLYAKLKLKSEAELLKRAGNGFCPVILRQATIYGLSPRMRFDLAINLMTMHAVTKGKIFVLGGGNQWRPFLHVRDAAGLFKKALEAGERKVRGQIFNAGSNMHNFRIVDLAYKVKEALGAVKIEVAPEDPDKRDYNVDFSKVHNVLGFKPSDMDAGIKEIAGFVKRDPKKDYDTGEFFNMKMLKEYAKKAALKGGEPVRFAMLTFDDVAMPQAAKLQTAGKKPARKKDGAVFDFVRAGEGFDVVMRACGARRGDAAATGGVCETWLSERLKKYGMKIRAAGQDNSLAVSIKDIGNSPAKNTKLIFLSEFDLASKLKKKSSAVTIVVTSAAPLGSSARKADAVIWKTWDVPKAASAPAARVFVNKPSLRAAFKRLLAQRENGWLETPLAGELISAALDESAEKHRAFHEKLRKLKKAVAAIGNSRAKVLTIAGKFGLLFKSAKEAGDFIRLAKAERMECAHIPPGFGRVGKERDGVHNRTVFLPVGPGMGEKDVADVIRLMEKLLPHC